MIFALVPDSRDENFLRSRKRFHACLYAFPGGYGYSISSSSSLRAQTPLRIKHRDKVVLHGYLRTKPLARMQLDTGSLVAGWVIGIAVIGILLTLQPAAEKTIASGSGLYPKGTRRGNRWILVFQCD